MAHFAKLDEKNVVLNVIKVDNADIEANGGDWSTQAEQWVNNTFGGTYKQTSYNSIRGKYQVETVTSTDENGEPLSRSFQELENDSRCRRWNFASIGGTYDPTNDVFIIAKPHPSWTLKTSDWTWEAPVAYPTTLTYGDNQPYYTDWDEDNQRWLGYDADNNEFAWDPDGAYWVATGN
jgi:hypothetical protein